MTDSLKIIVYKSGSDLENGMHELLKRLAKEAIAARGKFTLGVSGGSMAKQLTAAVPDIYPKGQEEWKKWHVFFCDERIVAFDDKESTYGDYKKNLIAKVPELESQFVVIDPSKDAENNALHYHNQLVQRFGNAMFPIFDLLLTGMGPDGHTCSLFPGHPLLEERRKWVAAITDSPKPPPSRITLTLPVLNHARNVAFIVAGSNKAEAVKKVLEDQEKLPSGMVQPQSNGGKLYWMLDSEAASGLKNTRTHTEL
ncbi:hypothetical protein RvY_18507 [Ramazzottius varieornatus]|uniref:6-phosphogluconolactonase n=1 Tax=Ramazzottius varieornatus TaxID=947166 RepID=A0A1D1W620_RAMVA|nr:hypothetical protein RvY_18507 [Ramazzottius varieornatus]